MQQLDTINIISGVVCIFQNFNLQKKKRAKFKSNSDQII